MNWSSIEQFIAMGGYAGYVWGSIGMVALLVALEVLLVRQRWRRALGVPRAAHEWDRQ